MTHAPEDLKWENTYSLEDLKASEEYCAYLVDVDQKFEFPLCEISNAFLAGISFARRWIPVSERLPEEGQRVVGFLRYGKTPVWYEVYFVDGFFESVDNIRYRENVITHWQPITLPEEVK